ncbi:acetyltransferase [Rhizobium sp. L9]|uniref:acetyltransferase n=1 Tax=Rhizobium sp. L9 TaxID=1340738 RepID=UPI001FE0D924|nr:acetyltransferase [Rhizobium sp. L9]
MKRAPRCKELAPKALEKPDDMMCSAKKISPHEDRRSIVCGIKIPAAMFSQEEHRTIAETRKGTKTNRAGPGKGNAFPRREMRSPP